MDKLVEKKSKKYKSILSAAYTLLGENGLKSVSIDDIVKAAGVAKGTFYLYFQDKYDLIAKLVMEMGKDYMSRLEDAPQPIEGEEDLPSHIKKYIELISLFLEKNKALTLLIDKNIHICVKALIEHRSGVIKSIYDSLSDYFEQLGFSPREVEIKMYIFINLIISSCCNAVLYESPYTPEELKPHIYDIVILNVLGAKHRAEWIEGEG